MGACSFITTATGANALEAFRSARERAFYEFGHAGYTGSIAEKDSFAMIDTDPLPSAEATELAEKLMREDDERVRDKWGPAGCIPIAQPEGSITKRYLFFGNASS